MEHHHSFGQQLFAEFVGTSLLLMVIVGSGAMAAKSTHDAALQLLAIALAVAGALAGLVLIFGPVSGAHYNPCVTFAGWLYGRIRGNGEGQTTGEALAFMAAQIAGAIVGCILANLMYALDAVSISKVNRTGTGIFLSEVIATAGLLLIIRILTRTGRGDAAPWCVAAYVGSAIYFTASTCFANPAVTIGRIFTSSITGIRPIDAVWFIIAQFVGTIVAMLTTYVLYGMPDKDESRELSRAGVVVPEG